MIASSFALAGQTGQADPAPDRHASRAEVASEAIRPFKVHISDKALKDMKARLQSTRWPDKETVSDASQGVQLAKLQELVRYWQGDYDWRKLEARLNALPQFTTTIDGVDIQFLEENYPTEGSSKGKTNCPSGSA